MNSKEPTIQMYSALNGAYSHFNQHLFNGRLPSCLLTVQRQPRMMGYASHERWINQARQFVDELAINPEYFLGGTLLEVFQTLVHEQCHIWQYHFGTPSRRKYHNAEWADKMESVGLMPSDTGLPGGKRTGEHMADYVIDNGSFLAVARQFIADGFELPWVDRRGISHVPSQHAFSASGELISFLQSDCDLVAKIGINKLENPFKHGKSFEISTSPEQFSNADGIQGAEKVVQFIPAVKKATRVKYRCDCCSAQVWGKPSLNIICGDCNVSYILVDSSMEDEVWQQIAKSNGRSKPGTR